MAYKSNVSNVKRSITQKRKTALSRIGKAVKRNTREITPVLTGDLRSSVEHEVINAHQVVIGAYGSHSKGKAYAKYVHFGTRKMNSRPFLTDGLVDSMDEINNIIEWTFKEGD